MSLRSTALAVFICPHCPATKLKKGQKGLPSQGVAVPKRYARQHLRLVHNVVDTRDRPRKGTGRPRKTPKAAEAV